MMNEKLAIDLILSELAQTGAMCLRILVNLGLAETRPEQELEVGR